MVIFGRSLSSWIIAIILAVLLWVLCTVWPLPQLINGMLHLGAPDIIFTLVGLVLAAMALFGHYSGWYVRTNEP